MPPWSGARRFIRSPGCRGRSTSACDDFPRWHTQSCGTGDLVAGGALSKPDQRRRQDRQRHTIWLRQAAMWDRRFRRSALVSPRLAETPFPNGAWATATTEKCRNVRPTKQKGCRKLFDGQAVTYTWFGLQVFRPRRIGFQLSPQLRDIDPQ